MWKKLGLAGLQLVGIRSSGRRWARCWKRGSAELADTWPSGTQPWEVFHVVLLTPMTQLAMSSKQIDFVEKFRNSSHQKHATSIRGIVCRRFRTKWRIVSTKSEIILWEWQPTSNQQWSPQSMKSCISEIIEKYCRNHISSDFQTSTTTENMPSEWSGRMPKEAWCTDSQGRAAGNATNIFSITVAPQTQ